MKRLVRILGIGTMMLSVFFFMGSPVKAQEDVALNQKALNEVYAEEVYAKEMYQQMVEKFDNDDYYERFIKSETRHAGSVERFLERNDLSVKKADEKVKVSDDELTALKAAYKFEVDDVKSLEDRIKKTTNEDEIKVYERLKARSENHAKSLKAAIELFEEGEIKIAENLSCNQNRNNESRKYNNKGNMSRANGDCGSCTNENRQARGNGQGMRDGSANGQQINKQEMNSRQR